MWYNWDVKEKAQESIGGPVWLCLYAMKAEVGILSIYYRFFAHLFQSYVTF